MNLEEVREHIDRIDAQLIKLFNERLDLAPRVVKAKLEMGKPVFDPGRERDKLAGIAQAAPQDRQAQLISLFSLLMNMNKIEQNRYLASLDQKPQSKRAINTLLPADAQFPVTASVACQGVEGAYSQLAASKLFKVPSITFFDTFEGVFRAVRDGLCDYGVLPIENSTAGSVNAVYDLLALYRFSIVRSLRLKIDHNLVAKPGTRREDIREVISHEQALAQCADFIESMGVKATTASNTAQAAEFVASSERNDIAALCSRSCKALYNLDILQEDVQDSDNNYTRFVVITKDAVIYPGADRTSLMLMLPHQPGSLYRVLERFYALDINLVKLESRPIPGHDFDFMFYFDLICPVGSQPFMTLLDSLDDVCEQYTYFGSYQEVL